MGGKEYSFGIWVIDIRFNYLSFRFCRFRSNSSALEFYQMYNGAAYNSLEPDSLCHAVWVSEVEMGDDGVPPLGHTELPTCPGELLSFHKINNYFRGGKGYTHSQLNDIRLSV